MKEMKRYSIILLVILVAVGVLVLSPSILNKQKSEAPSVNPTVQISETKNSFTYDGKSETDALKLLKEKTEVVQDDSGLVTSINGRAADPGQREYWSFYVNGQMASVGPADYVTKDSDKIEWKIETY